MVTIFKKLRSLLRSPMGTSALVLICAFLLAAVAGGTDEQKSPEPKKVSAPAAPAAIPVAEIAPRATEVSNLLRTFEAMTAPGPEIETIRKILPEVGRSIDLELAGTMHILQGQPTLATLQTQQQLWQQNQLQTTVWLNALTKRAEQLEDALTQLAALQKTWTMTLDAAQAAKAPEPVLQQAHATLAAIAAAQPPLQEQRSAVLDLQSRVSRVVAVCGTTLAQIAHVQQRVVVGTFVQDSPPIWSARLWAQAKATAPGDVGKAAAVFLADVERYVTDPLGRMPLHAALLAVLTFMFWAARRQVRQWKAVSKTEMSATMVFHHPYAAALTVTLIIITSPFSYMPATVRALFEALALAPMIVLIKSAVEVHLVSGLYLLGILFAVDTVRKAFSGVPLLGRAILIFESFLGIVALGWLLTFGGLRLSGVGKTGVARPGGLRFTAFLILFALSVCLVAAVTGYTSLARLITPGILVGGAVALALYASVRIASGVVAFGFRMWPLRKLRMVQYHRDLLEKRVYRLFIWAAIIAGFARFLDYMGLLDSALSSGRYLLATKLERGAISISTGDVLAFFLTLWAAYLLSAFIRFVLQEDVYPRLGVAPGQSYAASSLLHYVILALGFVTGLGIMGVNLTRVTVLAGALGVGIGFGLQGVVNNFVSGLILLFERPIRAGDTVEVGNLLGRVRRIGMRASTVRTVQGSDIIVPNSQFVTEKVTNWTLSDQLMCIDLPVGVNYGARPKEVIRLLEEVAHGHPGVLQHPAPQCLFTGYGDSSINFELKAWTDRIDEWRQIRSQLAVAVYDAVYGAGMTFPFPQREVRMLRDSESGHDGTSASEGLQTLFQEKHQDKGAREELNKSGEENDLGKS